METPHEGMLLRVLIGEAEGLVTMERARVVRYRPGDAPDGGSET